VVIIAAENSQKTCSPGNPAPGGNPGLKRTRVGAIFKKFFMKTFLKSKINLIRKVLNFESIRYYETICRPPQSRETIPLIRSAEHHRSA
jgi:hypothetical protein